MASVSPGLFAVQTGWPLERECRDAGSAALFMHALIPAPMKSQREGKPRKRADWRLFRGRGNGAKAALRVRVSITLLNTLIMKR